MNLCELDSLCSRLGYGINTVDAIRVAMDTGDFVAEEFTGALLFAYYGLCDLQKELEEFVNNAFEERRNSK